jgi:hypothetical protein
MNKETLRMQMLAGVITESEYKAKLEEATQKDSLNEHYVAGGIVGIGAINQIPSRAKADYETAFEHFLGQKYGINEEMDEVEEGKEVEEPSLYEAEGMKVTFLKQDEIETLPEEPTNEYEEDLMDAYLFDVDQNLFDRTYSSLEDLAQTIVDENGGDVANWVSILNRMVKNGIISIG